MKLRAGFVSNSSTASFVVKTKPTKWDKLFTIPEKYDSLPSLSPEKIELLKQIGFVSVEEENPFIKELTIDIQENIKSETSDDTLLGYWVGCNEMYILQFLVANDISFQAATHYSHYLYSYNAGDSRVYRLRNFGIEYLNRANQLKEKMENPEEHKWDNFSPIKVFDKKEFLEDYNEEEALEFLKPFK